MLQSATRLFVDLAVGKKLFCGFGLVLLLTAAMTGTGFVAIEEVLEGHDLSGRLVAVNMAILQARRLERNFALEQTPESAARVRESLVGVQQLLTQLQGDAAAAEVKHYRTMDQAVADYLAQFDSYV